MAPLATHYACEATRRGHSNTVSAIVPLPDGRTVSSSYDNTLRVWDRTQSASVQLLKGPEPENEIYSDEINSIAVFKDGRRLVTGSDKGVALWDLSAGGRCVQQLNGHTGIVRCVAVLNDDRVVSGAEDYTLRIFDVSNGRCLHVLTEHASSVFCVVTLSDWIVSGSGDGKLKHWNSNGLCLSTLIGNEAAVMCLCVLPGGLICSGCTDGVLRTWDLKYGHCLKVLNTSMALDVYSIAVLPDGRVVCVDPCDVDENLRRTLTVLVTMLCEDACKH